MIFMFRVTTITPFHKKKKIGRRHRPGMFRLVTTCGLFTVLYILQTTSKPESCQHLIHHGGDKDVDSIPQHFFSFTKADGRPQTRINKQQKFPYFCYCVHTFWGCVRLSTNIWQTGGRTLLEVGLQNSPLLSKLQQSLDGPQLSYLKPLKYQ